MSFGVFTMDSTSPVEKYNKNNHNRYCKMSNKRLPTKLKVATFPIYFFSKRIAYGRHLSMNWHIERV